MIEFIEIKNIATFDGAGVEIVDLQRINFIYGGNGTGKTTIANYLENPDHQDYSACKLHWKDNDKIEILVYNDNFKERNFGRDKLQGIFTLGEASINLNNTLEQIETKLKSIVDEGKELRKKLNEGKEDIRLVENGFRESSWQGIRKHYLSVFREAFKGGGTKMRFTELLLQKFENRTGEENSLQDLKKRAAILFSDQPSQLSLIPSISLDEILEIEEHPIWSKVIVGKEDLDFSRLVQKLNISDWVHQGTEYIRRETCPFCQQNTLTEDLRAQIEDFFDDTYSKDTQWIKELTQKYILLTDHITARLNEIQNEQKASSDTKLDIESFSSSRELFVNRIARNKEMMKRKIREPSRKVEFISLTDICHSLTTFIHEANLKIQNHNDIIKDFFIERNLLIDSIWEYILDENSLEIQSYLESKTRLDEKIEKLSTQIKEKGEEYRNLNEEIKKLHRRKGGFQPTIDEINKMLVDFNFLNFTIVPSAEEGFFQIQRHDGSDAEQTLSEGEKSLVLFLYFLQLTKGGFTEEDLRKDRLLVIDDPTAHMDDRLLNIISTLLGELMTTIKSGVGPVKQLILLTHDRSFFEKISCPDASDNTSYKDSYYWILRKEGRTTKVDVHQSKNPLAIFN